MDGWEKIQKDMYQGEAKKTKHLSTFLPTCRSGLDAETGWKKIYVEKIIERQKKSIQTKETYGDGCGSNYIEPK